MKAKPEWLADRLTRLEASSAVTTRLVRVVQAIWWQDGLPGQAGQ